MQSLRRQASTGTPPLIAVIRFPVNKLSMNLASQLVNHRYLEVLIVTETLVAEVPDNFSAVRNCLRLCFEFNSNAISMRDAIFQVEEKFLHRDYLCAPIRHVSIRSERTARAVQQSDRNHCRTVGLPMHDRMPTARGLRSMAAPDAPALGPLP
jgi:hypothetical protein